LTACRSGEVRGATWSEIDLKHAPWTIPADRIKAGREQRVPLANQRWGKQVADSAVAAAVFLFVCIHAQKAAGMTIPNLRETSVLALVRLQDQRFPLLPIRPLNSINYTRMLLGDVGPTTIYKLIDQERLEARKLGSQTRITGESIQALIDSLPRGVTDSPQPEGRRKTIDSLPKGVANSLQPGRRSLSQRDRSRAREQAEPELNDLK
jgi:hypothetical protein